MLNNYFYFKMVSFSLPPNVYLLKTVRCRRTDIQLASLQLLSDASVSAKRFTNKMFAFHCLCLQWICAFCRLAFFLFQNGYIGIVVPEDKSTPNQGKKERDLAGAKARKDAE